jgi:hypothetical protein
MKTLLRACLCGQPTLPEQPFCSRCYLALPDQIRRNLAETFGEVYELAYHRAAEWLAAQFNSAKTA